MPSSKGVVLVLGLLLVLAWPAPTGVRAQATSDPYVMEMRRIAGKLQCPICEGESVTDSHSAIAADMRRIISEQLAGGRTEPQILQYFVDRYGVAILRDPPRTGFYAAVWWIPVLALALGVGVVYAVARSRRPSASDDGSTTALSGEDLEAYRRRLRDMERGNT